MVDKKKNSGLSSEHLKRVHVNLCERLKEFRGKRDSLRVLLPA